jgi:putative oxygen-independent coproporphyrinogen III oxidase
MKPLHIYIHWPFCKSKCPYCDFNSHVREAIDNSAWLEGYLREIDFFRDIIASRTIKTIFFGGGTPSLMPPNNVIAILEKLKSISRFDNIEITLEANPTSSEYKKFQDFKEAGINRLSIGIQSFIEEDLKFLGREHSVAEGIATLESAAKVFDNYSFDLIYARPNQSLSGWEQELKTALQYAKDHLSLYQLTIEKGTKFYSDFKKHRFTIPDQEEALALYEMTTDILRSKNLLRYEISNYALSGKESQHNLGYWNYREYLGIGAGAHSKIKIKNKLHHIFMIHNPEKWLSSVFELGNGMQQKQEMTDQQIVIEFLLMGLRLEDGVRLAYCKENFNIEIMDFLSKDAINFFTKNGFILHDSNRLFLTDSGKMVLNDIVTKITL